MIDDEKIAAAREGAAHGEGYVARIAEALPCGLSCGPEVGVAGHHWSCPSQHRPAVRALIEEVAREQREKVPHLGSDGCVGGTQYLVILDECEIPSECARLGGRCASLVTDASGGGTEG